VARHFGGEFLLRIEDTDQERSTQEAVNVILDAMKWLNLDYDNKNVVYQMQRLDRYRQVAQELLDRGLAYYCYATKEELEQMREEQKAKGEKPRYDGRWRPENCKGRPIPEGVTPVIRFRNPDDGVVSWNDGVYGQISIANSELDDLVIMRGDGIPTYNFAVVIDDWDMQISHVIRGADHINNTPRQINIYKAIGAPLPEFAHLPLIHGEDGQKLSKRHGTVSVLAYKELGYLPEAIFNYLARLGWAHGDEEKFTREQLAEWFELKDCSRSAAQFSMDKLNWLNHEYIKEASDERLAELVKPRLEALGANAEDHAQLLSIVALLKDRAQTLQTLAEEAMLFYREPHIDPDLLKEQLESNEGRSLAAVKRFLEVAKETEWRRENILAAIKSVMKEQKVKMPHIAIPIRVLVTGEKHTPSIDATLEILGKDFVIQQIENGLKGW
jgi:glutamyl-tRNA synthetase